MKKIDLLWSLSLLIIGIVTIVLAGARIMGIELPDIVIRILGILELMFLPLLVYTGVKKLKRGK